MFKQAVAMDFNRMLEICGNFGCYQVVLLLCFAYTSVVSALHYFSQTIICFIPKHWCQHEKFFNMTTTQIAEIYATATTIKNPSCTLLDDVVNNTIAVVANEGVCREWVYARHHNFQSVPSELNWVCDNAYKVAAGQSPFYIGSCLGTILFGLFADRIGRLPALILSTVTGAFGDFLTAFTTSLPLFAVGRFISGLSCDTKFYLMYILAFEYLSPQKRTFGLNITTAIFYTLGTTISPWVAIWIGDWRKFLFASSSPAFGVLLYPFLISESAHWLITKRDYPKAVQCLKRVAKYNGRQVDESVYAEFVKHYKEKTMEDAHLNKAKQQADTFWHMFRNKRLRNNTIALIIKSMIVTMTLDIASRNMQNLGSSPFYLFSFSSVAYLPGGLTLILLQNIIGRKGMAFTSLMGGAIITAVTGYLIAVVRPEEHPLLLAAMVFLGRYAVIVSYDAEVQYAAEIIPTSVRGQGVSVIHLVGYACSFLSPYIIYMGTYYKPLPSILIAFLMVIAALLCFTLPETLNKSLPETIKDGETFGLGEKWYFFPCFSRTKNNKKHNSTKKPDLPESYKKTTEETTKTRY